MNKEYQLLKQLADSHDKGIIFSVEEGIFLERELAKLYMPQVDKNISDAELLEWGTKFKSIVTQRLEMFRNGQLV